MSRSSLQLPLKILLAIVIPLVLLELALQVGAYVTWRRAASPAVLHRPSSGEEQTVLCIGDSFTYGLGAKSPEGSYPNQLERLLNARGQAARVINSAWPGQNSLEALQRAKALLAEYHPGLVCIMLGRNDGWSRPPLRSLADLDKSDAGHPFHWTWRTGRLVKILFDRIRMTQERTGSRGDQVAQAESRNPSLPSGSPSSSPAAPAAVVLSEGEWCSPNAVLRFEKEGWLDAFLGTALRIRYTASADQLALSLAPGREYAMRWRIEQDKLVLIGNDLPAPVVLQHQRRGASRIHVTRKAVDPDEASQALQSGDLERAVVLYQQLVRQTSLPMYMRMAALTLYKLGRLREADDYLERLRHGWTTKHDQYYGEAFASALQNLKLHEEAQEVTKDLVARFPESRMGWFTLASEQFVSYQTDAAIESTQRSLALAKTPSEKAPLIRFLAMLTLMKNPLDAASPTIEEFRAFLMDGDTETTIRELRRSLNVMPRDYLDTCAQQMDLTPEDRARIAELLRRLDNDSVDPTRVFESHLRQLIAVCRNANADVLLLSYPEIDRLSDPVLPRIAAETNTTYLDLKPHFKQLLAQRHREELFVTDGHCTDAGYGEIAAIVANHVMQTR